ncbi:MAG: hypothetical protein O7G85_04470 [Planctomycetota bacterium]|nr:hypothetical protein [Planctomycetota bacterium]
MMDEPPQPLELPRGLIFISALWLIGTWIIAMGVSTPVQTSSASYTPSFRLMLLCIVIGLMIGWPLLRLSQAAHPYPIKATLLDLSVLISMIQVILWPLRLITPWSIQRTAAIDATICAWLLLAGAVVASAIGTNRKGPRNLAMLTCIAMCLLGPALATMGIQFSFLDAELIELSPLMAVHTLTEGAGAHPLAQEWQWIGLLGFAAISVWIVLGSITVWKIRPALSGLRS